MIRLSLQHSPTFAHGKLLQSPLRMPNSVTSFWSMPNVTFKEQEQVLKYRTNTIHTDNTYTKRFSHTTGPATCPLCGGSDSAPHILLRCNSQTLKRMHIKRHHHAVAFVVKKSVKASWAQQLLQWMLVTVKSYLTLTLNFLMKLKETFLTGFSQYNKTFQLDIKAVQMTC